jgi:hypothetical protein
LIRLPTDIPAGKQVAGIYVYKPDDVTKYIWFNAGLGVDRRTLLIKGVFLSPPGEPLTGRFPSLTEYGFEAGMTVRVDVYSPGEDTTAGLSPSRPVGGKFQGKSFVFATGVGDPSTMIHELGHALGLAHHTYVDYTGTKTNVMAYDTWWVEDPVTHRLAPWSGYNVGLDFSAQALRFLRHTKLEDDSTAQGRILEWR